MVCHVSYRVEGFLSWPCGYKEIYSVHVLITGDCMENTFQQVLRFRHFSCPNSSAGKSAAGRLYNFPAVFFKDFHIVLSYRIHIHFCVHCRSYNFRTVAGKYCCCKHIVGYSVGKLCHYVGGCRGNHNKVSHICQSYMLHLKGMVSVKCVGDGSVSCEVFKGQR